MLVLGRSSLCDYRYRANEAARICLGQQFAYNEASFTLVRLMQAFDSISLARDVQPEETLPPASWAKAPGRQAIEKIVPKQHLTMYSHVRLRQSICVMMKERLMVSQGGLWVRLGVPEYVKAADP